MGRKLIEFRGVTKRFGDRTILDGVDLTIHEGDITTIIGKSGTGKSVLLKHIIGLLKPDEGTILFRGKPVDMMSRREWDHCRARISYMFQNNALFDSMTVFENVALPLHQTTRLGRAEIEEKVRMRLEQTETIEVADKYPSELSGGMQKRVALARALVTDPEIVLFDEPTTGQDPIRKNAILSMIAQYKKKFGFTAVLISHDIPDVFFISDRILMLWEGKIAFQGTYEDASRLEHPMVDEFLRSLEGFRDELTGLLTKHAFKVRYDNLFRRKRPEERQAAAILFSVELESLCERAGHESAIQVVKSLCEFITENLDFIGGFSARQKQDHVLTILPGATVAEAEEILARLRDVMHAGALCDLEKAEPTEDRSESCVEIQVDAGAVDVRPYDEINTIIERAKSNQKIFARHLCKKRG